MVAFYIRLSRLDDDLDEYRRMSNSVENQRKLLSEYVKEIPDLRTEDTEEFIDDGYSGTNFQRPAFQRMLGLIKKRTVTTVVVKDFSRFGRNYVECADYLEKLFPFLGTRFISVADNYDSGRKDEDRQIEVAMKNIVNSYYSQDLSRKITSTFNMKREKGEFFFNVPFGYLKDEDCPGNVVIDEEAAEIVRHIFSLACEGWKTGMIAKILNRENVLTVAAYNRLHKIRGKKSSREKSEYAAWTSSKVAHILKNEVYMGTYISQKTKRTTAGIKKSVAVRNSEKIPDNHPTIVSGDTFEKAQEIFTVTLQKPQEDRCYQLKSKIFCGNCGYAMAYQCNIYDDCFFYCNHKAQTGLSDGCPDERFSEELINERVFIRLRSWMKALEAAYGDAAEAEEKRLEALRLLNDEEALLRAALSDIEAEKLRSYERYGDCEISPDDFMIEKQKLIEEAGSVRAELDRLHEKESKLRTLRNRRKPELDDFMESIRLFDNEPRLTCKMAEVFIDRVTVYDKWHIEIEWKCEDVVE